jgi:Ser/Thr protein kinase RdoA (MazF antagonist)
LDDPYRVAFAHELQLHLARRSYAVPGLLGTRGDNNSMLQFNGRVYELFNYIHGTRYERSTAQANLAGAALGMMHLHMSDFLPQFEAPQGSFHGVSVEMKMASVPAAILSMEPQGDSAAVKNGAEYLARTYKESTRKADALGFRQWPRTILHGDWHPGNLLFRDGRIVAVLDFDSVRMEPHAADVANALLQFAMQTDKPEDPSTWPEGFDPHLIDAILRGYDEGTGQRLRSDERRALPWLMIEAMVMETVVPLAATGSFARIPGSVFLGMVERKVRWIERHAEALGSDGGSRP